MVLECGGQLWISGCRELSRTADKVASMTGRVNSLLVVLGVEGISIFPTPKGYQSKWRDRVEIDGMTNALYYDSHRDTFANRQQNPFHILSNW